MELNIEHLDKSYDKKNLVLQNIDLKINSGVTGLIGPNGAGKTNPMKIISTLIKPTNGRVLCNGTDIQ